ncbi:MAG: EthD domain-containing protein [Acidimicrobiales bacterium]
MIRLTALLRRNPTLSPTVFASHWRTTHAQLIRSLPRIDDWVVRYEQHPRLQAPGHWTGTEDVDGVAMQWFRDLDSLAALIKDPDYRHLVAPDEQYLLDMERSVFVVTEEPRVIIDG